MKKLWCVAALWIALTGCTEVSEHPAIAIVGDREIPLYEITEDFVQMGMPEFSSAEEELQAKREYLDSRIEEALLIKAAYAHGLDTDIEILELVERERGKFLLDELFRVEILEKVSISKKEIREWYKHWFTRVRARHILAGSRHEADSLRQEIIGGADFAAIARAVSKDPESRRRGGDLGRVFRWGDLVPNFQEALFSLELDKISKPVETEYGWHIVELLEKNERTRLALDSVRGAIETKIKSLKQKERQLEHQRELKDRYPIEIVPETIEFLKGKIIEFSQVDTVSLPDSLRQDVDLNFLSELEREKPFGRYLSDQVMTLGQYLELVNPAPPGRKPSLDDRAVLENFVFQNVTYELLADQARHLGLEKAKLYTTRIKSFTESMMAEKMRTTILRRGVSVTESEIREYFDAYPDEFVSELRLRVREIQTEAKREADSLHQLLKGGASFADLAKEHTIRRGYKRNKGDLGYIKPYRHPTIYGVAETLKVGELSAPFAADEAWSVIKLTERIEPAPMTFESIKGKLFTALREARIDLIHTAYVDSLKSVTPISIDEQMLAGTVDHSLYEKKPSPTGESPDSLKPGGQG